MFYCEAKTSCTVPYGNQGLTRYYGKGERDYFHECPKHFRVLAEVRRKGSVPEAPVSKEPEELPEVEVSDGLTVPKFTDKDEAEDWALQNLDGLNVDKRMSLANIQAFIEDFVANAD